MGLLAILFTIPCRSEEKSAKPATVDDVVVKQLDLQMPADGSPKDDVLSQPPREKFLWGHFFNQKDEPSFGHITTREWSSVAEQLQEKLVAKARKLNLPAEALDKALHAIANSPANEGLAVIPVGAYLIRDGDRDAWAVVCNWEYAGPIEVKFHSTSVTVRWKTVAQARIRMAMPRASAGICIFSSGQRVACLHYLRLIRATLSHFDQRKITLARRGAD